MKLTETKQLDQTYHMNTFGSRTPIQFTYGKGSVLYDSNGKSYIDFLAGIAVNSLGYSHPKLVEAIREQAGRLLHCSNLFYIESQAKLAKLLSETSIGGKVFFCNSGAEANEAAIKLARKYFYDKGMNKYEVITACNSFHGRTLAALAATGQEKYQKPFHPMPSGFQSVPYNDLNAIEETITDKTAAVMIEVIQGEGGIIEGTREYIQGLETLCNENGLLLIIDEVQTGIGRTGKLFGYEHYGVKPDIVTLAKGLGSGIPIGAVIANGIPAEVFDPGSHGSTFGGNPLSCTAGLIVLETILEDGFLNRVSEKGQLLRDGLKQLQQQFGFVKDVRGLGLMLGMELDERITGKRVVEMAMEKGFLINCAGNNTLRFVPPLIITEQEIQTLLEGLYAIFTQVSLN